MIAANTNTLPTNNEPRFFRDFRHFTEDAFHQDLLAVDFKTLISNDVNESISAIVDNLRAITDCHAPLRKAYSNKLNRIIHTAKKNYFF